MCLFYLWKIHVSRYLVQFRLSMSSTEMVSNFKMKNIFWHGFKQQKMLSSKSLLGIGRKEMWKTFADVVIHRVSDFVMSSLHHLIWFHFIKQSDLGGPHICKLFNFFGMTKWAQRPGVVSYVMPVLCHLIYFLIWTRDPLGADAPVIKTACKLTVTVSCRQCHNFNFNRSNTNT